MKDEDVTVLEKVKDSFFMFSVIKVAGTSEKSSQRNHRLPALLENTDCLLASHSFLFSEKFAFICLFLHCFLVFVLCLLKTALL